MEASSNVVKSCEYSILMFETLCSALNSILYNYTTAKKVGGQYDFFDFSTFIQQGHVQLIK